MQNTKTPRSSADPKYIVLAVLVFAAVIVSGVNSVLLLSQYGDETVDDVLVGNNTSDDIPTPTKTAKYASLLEQKPNFSLPFGAAEVQAYYTKIERPTTLDNSEPAITCSALVIVDGPELLLKSLNGGKIGTPTTVVIGSADSYWTGVNESTQSTPVKLLVSLDPTFEGEPIGCMSVVFNSFTIVE